MKKDITSEEKLLNLIRKKNPADKKEKAKMPSGNPPGLMTASWGDISDFPKTATRLLLLFCLGLVFYIAMHLFAVKPANDDVLSMERTEVNPEEASGQGGSLPESRPFSEYAQIFDRRDLFMSDFQRLQSPSAAPAVQPEAVSAAPASNLAQNFRLVGIIVDHDPRAVVEDIRNQKTLFLSHGDQVDGAVLKEIKEGGVVFTVNDQEIEMVP